MPQITTMTYTISADERESTGVITITIQERLEAKGDELEVDGGETIVFDPKLNDKGPTGFRIVKVTQPSLGSVRITDDNQLEYIAP